MRITRGVLSIASLFLWMLAPLASAQTPLGTAFTYQGRLTDSGAAANGSYDLQFKLFDAASSGSQAGGTITLTSVPVAGGLFTASLDFGAVFTGSKRFLEIGVRPGGASGAFTLPSARQEPAPAPNAVFSATAAAVSGVIGVQNGGTGQSTLLANGVVYGQGTSTLATTVGSAGQVLTGTAGAPAWSGSPSLIGNLTLVHPSTSITGNIMKGSNRFIHTFGSSNTFVGEQAGNFSMSGTGNTAIGAFAFQADTTGDANTALGAFALQDNTSGSFGTAAGQFALTNNPT